MLGTPEQFRQGGQAVAVIVAIERHVFAFFFNESFLSRLPLSLYGDGSDEISAPFLGQRLFKPMLSQLTSEIFG
jgi:hypothetical protein